MGAHFWGQVVATAITTSLVLNLMARLVEFEALRAQFQDVGPRASFFFALAATLVGGVLVAVVIWS